LDEKQSFSSGKGSYRFISDGLCVIKNRERKCRIFFTGKRKHGLAYNGGCQYG
jgi:hypothetical protein